MDDSRYHKEQLIETKELPIVAFCVICDKPIYVGQEYEEVEYFDDGGHKRFDKKHLSKGLAHRECAAKMHEQVHEIKKRHVLKQQYVLALAVVIGFAIALATMMTLIFTLDKSLLALSIILPWVAGYLITSTIYIYLSHNRLSEFYQKSSMFLFRTPITIFELDLFLFAKILFSILLVPLAYIILVAWVAILLVVSAVAFPFLIIKLTKKN